jgi:hypothetical protein
LVLFSIGMVAISLTFIGALPSGADSTSGSSTATVNIAVRSVNVSPSTTTFNQCYDANGNLLPSAVLVFPFGMCQTIDTAAVTITNGSAPGHIDVQGADAIPSDNGTHWTLCGGAGGPACTSSISNALVAGIKYPGQDQFVELTSIGGISGTLGTAPLTNSPQCDDQFGSSCVATSGQATTESLVLQGPTASTDSSSSFTTVWTWTAVP